MAFANGIESIAVRIIIGNTRHKGGGSGDCKILCYHQAVVALVSSVIRADADFLEAGLHRILAMVLTEKQVLMQRINIGICINGAAGPRPRKIFTRHPVPGKNVTRRLHPLERRTAVHPRVRKHVGAKHPGRMAIGRISKILIEGQCLLLIGGNRARSKTLIQINAIAHRFAGWIKPGPVDQFEKQLFLVGRRCHGDTFGPSNTFELPNQ